MSFSGYFAELSALGNTNALCRCGSVATKQDSLQLREKWGVVSGRPGV
jgi:hypothetical protein